MDKNITVDSINIFYQDYGKGNDNILLLHGWGQSHSFWREMIHKLGEKYHVYALDLPGFGLSKEPSDTWNITAFAEFIHNFILTLNVKNPVVIGHSFGGRIAIAYAAKYPVQKLVLYSTGGGVPEKSFKKNLYRLLFVNFGKYIFPNQLYKSQTSIYKPKNYENKIIINTKRSRRMLDIYTQTPEDLREELGKINTKTFIITGSNDYISDPKIGEYLRDAIKHSTLINIASAKHFAHLESPEVYYSKLNKFLSGR